jgi:hypothetical protein
VLDQERGPTQSAIDPAAAFSARLFDRVLDPMDRISEILFGVIMALTFTLTLGVVTAGDPAIRVMLLGALGCNLAWGIIDGSVFLMARFNQRGHNIMRVRAVRSAPDAAAAHGIIADELPPLLATALTPDQLETMRQKLVALPEPEPARLTRQDALGAIAICLLSFLSTFPIVIPFIVFGDVRLALRVSNVIACAMLFLLGYAFGHYAGFRPWSTGLAMTAVGGALVGVAILLGG